MKTAERTYYVAGLDRPSPDEAIACALYEAGGRETALEAETEHPGARLFAVTMTAVEVERPKLDPRRIVKVVDADGRELA